MVELQRAQHDGVHLRLALVLVAALGDVRGEVAQHRPIPVGVRAEECAEAFTGARHIEQDRGVRNRCAAMDQSARQDDRIADEILPLIERNFGLQHQVGHAEDRVVGHWLGYTIVQMLHAPLGRAGAADDTLNVGNDHAMALAPEGSYARVSRTDRDERRRRTLRAPRDHDRVV